MRENVVFQSNTTLFFSGVWLKHHSNCGVDNKDPSVERWNLNFGFQTPPLRRRAFALKKRGGGITKPKRKILYQFLGG